MNSGDLLAYYGTAFGIFGSFVTYRHETEKKAKERNRELKPIFLVDVKRDGLNPELFHIKLTNDTKSKVSYLYFYDEFVSPVIEKNYSFKVMYSQDEKNVETSNPDYNITVDDEILDSDNYPKYIQILCDDVDGNTWNCCYYKVKNGSKPYYYPRDFEII